MIRHRRFPISLLLAAIAVASLRCSSDSSDPGGQPDSVQEVSGNGQVGLINETLAQPLVVRVEDQDGRGPLEGVTVTWNVGGGGSVPAVGGLGTGSDGTVSVRRTLGERAGCADYDRNRRRHPCRRLRRARGAESRPLPNLILATPPSETAVNGEPFGRQPVVQLDDGTEQPAGAGIPVTATVDDADDLRHHDGRERRRRRRPVHRSRA